MTRYRVKAFEFDTADDAEWLEGTGHRSIAVRGWTVRLRIPSGAEVTEVEPEVLPGTTLMTVREPAFVWTKMTSGYWYQLDLVMSSGKVLPRDDIEYFDKRARKPPAGYTVTRPEPAADDESEC